MPVTKLNGLDVSVMLVDEQSFVHKSMRNLLADVADIELHSCFDGLEAVAMAEAIAPTVILQDIHMPDVNGLDLLLEYKNHPFICDIPVVMLTGTDDAEVKAEAFERGAHDYLVKMPHKVELVARLKAHSRSYMNELERKSALKALEEERAKLSLAYRELERYSSLDGLTNIGNRRFFDASFEREWKRAVREKKSLTIMMIDVDFFKLYNDSYGHQAGDECLKLVAESLKLNLQRPSDFVARYGGEEFVVLLSNMHLEGVEKVAGQLRSGIEQLGLPHEASDAGELLTISLGTASCFPSQESSAKALLKSADEALYEAKDAGRNRVVCRKF
ncbi:MAG: diguanylate cyclase [Mariprofundaceae bacterium]